MWQTITFKLVSMKIIIIVTKTKHVCNKHIHLSRKNTQKNAQSIHFQRRAMIDCHLTFHMQGIGVQGRLGNTRTRTPQPKSLLVFLAGSTRVLDLLCSFFCLLNTMSTEEIMIPKDFKVAIPEHTADLGRWMRQNGCSEAIIEIIIGE